MGSVRGWSMTRQLQLHNFKISCDSSCPKPASTYGFVARNCFQLSLQRWKKHFVHIIGFSLLVVKSQLLHIYKCGVVLEILCWCFLATVWNNTLRFQISRVFINYLIKLHIIAMEFILNINNFSAYYAEYYSFVSTKKNSRRLWGLMMSRMW